MQSIPYGRQHITEDDIQAVCNILRSDFLTQGPAVKQFEEAFANYIGCRYAIAVANGTAALHLSALALGVGPGQKVITTPITFAASANCVQYCGGEVFFADIDSDTYLIDINAVKHLLEANPKGTFSGIIPVDFAGKAVNLEALKALATEYGLWIIEDACHAPGGYFIDSRGRKQHCGNGNFAELAIFSFHPVKHIATGEGGMITTNDKSLYEKLMILRTHGITRNSADFKNSTRLANGQKSDSRDYPGWYMEMQTLGYNYRLSDIQAALGTSQLKRAPAGLTRRLEIAKRYDAAFKGHANIRAQLNELHDTASGHAYHLYVVLAENRLGLYDHLRKHQIFTQVHYIPVHLMPHYQNLGWVAGDFVQAEEYYSKCLSLPIYPTLTDADQAFVIDCVNSFYKGTQS